MLPLFYKIITKSSPESRQSLKTFVLGFGFFKSIHNDQKNKINNLDNAALADIAAAIISHFHKGLSTVVKECRDCCEKIMIKCGYTRVFLDESQIKNVFQSDTNETKNVILVLGAQDGKILDNRAKAVIKLLKHIVEIKGTATKQIIICSGGATNQDRDISETNESMTLHEILLKQTKKTLKKTLTEIAEIHPEDKSTKSTENLLYSIDKIILLYSKHVINLFVVSSTFHLPRLARECETLLRNDAIKEKLSTAQLKINTLCFVGAETPEDKTIFTPTYIKAMFFEVYDYLLKYCDLRNA